MFNLKKAGLLFLIVVMPFVAEANWGGYVEGAHSTGNLKIFGTGQVELFDEDLKIEFRQNYAMVNVRYIFRNTGADVTVKAGFPSRVFRGRRDLEGYEIKADGKPVIFSREQGSKEEAKFIEKQYSDFLMSEDEYDYEYLVRFEWLVSKVFFKALEQKSVTISYCSPYLEASQGFSDDDNIESPAFRYLLSTGAAWKGPIRKGKITLLSVGFDPEEVAITPAGRFKRNGSSFVWEFKDLKPSVSDDLTVALGKKRFLLHHYSRSGTVPYHRIGDDYYYLIYRPQDMNASSTLKKDGSEYRAGNLSDGKLDTAWAPGKNDGVGESIIYEYKVPVPVNQFAVYPGYGKSWDMYQANNRVAELSICINGEHTELFSFKDIPGKTWLLTVKGYDKPVRKVRFTILKVFKGSKYSDTPISEIEARQYFKSVPKIHGPG